MDVVVVGLGGSVRRRRTGLARRPGVRVLGPRAVRARPPHRGVARTSAGSSACSYHRPDYVRLAARAYDDVGGGRGARAARRIVTGPAASTSGRARRPTAPRSTSTPTPTRWSAEGVPFERLDARRGHAPLAGVAAGRRARRPVPGGRRHRRPVARQRGPPRLATAARRDAPGPHARSRASGRRRRRGRRWRSRTASGSRRARSSSPRTPGPTSCSRRSAPGCR